MLSTLKLFKALPINNKKKEKASKALLQKTIKLGFLFSPEVIANYNEKELDKFIAIISKEFTLSKEQLNNSFHKSWKKVKNASIEQLIIEQIIHYITTYSFENLGIYDSNTVYVPCEELEIPKIDIDIDKIPLLLIKGYTKEELKEKLLNILNSGIALKDDTKQDVIDIITFVGIEEKEILELKNREVKTALYELLNIIPEDSLEFLRYLLYKSTGKTLLIKDKATITEIKGKDNLSVLALLMKYKEKYGLNRLGEIFYRFKPLWLAFRTKKQLKVIINRIRKLAYINHKPFKGDYLNEVTSNISKGNLKLIQLKEALNKTNIFRKIRLAYALKFRTIDNKSILYRIRNGKSWATEFDFNKQDEVKKVLTIVLDSISESIEKNVKGKKIYIPNYINYTLPSTEKQFTGYFPTGTSIVVNKDLIFGIHWEKLNGDSYNNRIDLDLSLIDHNGNKTGWDADYRNESRTILFSGDMTDAPKPKGASELFYIKKQKELKAILIVNYYNYSEEEIPFKIITAKELVKDFNKNYTVNPNNIIAIANSKIFKEKQKILGLLVSNTNENRFFFAETYLGNTISSYVNDNTKIARDYLFNYYVNSISLIEVLEKAGAKIISNKEKSDIDLSPEKLEKDTILKLLI